MTVNRTAFRRRLALTTALCAAVLAAAPVAAQNTTVTNSGTATTGTGSGITFQLLGKLTVINSPTNNIIGWDKFNIAADETVRFSNSAGSNAPNIAILNRVTGGTFSDISGSLTSDPNVAVYLINPNGIVFGDSARVNVGSLVASSLNITNDNDFLNGNTALRFTGPNAGGTGVIVRGGAIINTGLGGSLGDMILLGNFTRSLGTISSSGDIGMIAGEDITITRTAGSPLKVRIDRGTIMDSPVVLGGSITGRNVVAGFFSRAGAFDALLKVNADAVVTATAVGVTAAGVVLEAGKTTGSYFQGDYTTDNGAYAEIDVVSSAQITGKMHFNATGDANLLGILNASRAFINSDSDVSISDISATDSLQIDGHVIDIGAARVLGSGNMWIRYAESLNFGSLFSTSAINIESYGINSQGISGGTLTATGTIRVLAPGDINISGVNGKKTVEIISSNGNFTNSDLQADENITVTAGGVASFSNIDGDADVSIAAKDIRLQYSGITAKGKASLVASESIDLKAGVNAGNVLLDAKTIKAANLDSATGDVEVRAWDGNATLGTVSGGKIFLTSAGTGNIEVAAANARTSFNVLASGTFTGGEITTPGDVAVVASNVVLNGDLSAAKINLDGNNVTAQKLTSGSTILVTAYGSDANIGSIDAAGSAAINTGGTGNVTVTGDVKTGGDFGIGATGSARIDGNVDAGSNYSIEALAISLGGDADAEVQRAGGDIVLKSTYGSIVGGEGLTLNANRNGNAAGKMSLTSASDIFFADNSNQIVGGDGPGIGDLYVKAGSVSRSIKLGDIRAGSITGLQITSGSTSFPLSSVTMGDVDLSGGLQALVDSLNIGSLKAGGDLYLSGGVVVDGDISTTGAISITQNLASGGSIKAAGDVFIYAMNPVVAGSITSTGGNVGLQAVLAAKTGDIFAAGNINVLRNYSSTPTVAVGALNAGGSVTLDVTKSTVNGNVTAGDGVTILGNDHSIAGNVTAVGNVKILGTSLLANNVSSSGGSVNIQTVFDTKVADVSAATDVVIGSTDPAGADNITVGAVKAGRHVILATQEGDINLNGNIQAGDSVDINSVRAVTMADGVGISANQSNGTIKVTSRGARLGALSAHDIILRAYSGEAIHLNGNVEAVTFDLSGGIFDQANGAVVNVGKLTGRDLKRVLLYSDNRIAEIGDLSAADILGVRNVGDGLLVSGKVELTGPFEVPLTIETKGTLTLAAGSSLSGRRIVLSGNRFVNNGGALAVNASEVWKIVTDGPDGNIYGGLDSGQTAIWGYKDGGANDFGTGNRYLFRYQPTLTFTSTDYAKTYGDDIAALLAGHYTVSGLHAGVAGAFLGDTLADVISGSPLLTSLGATARASVAGGPYVIEIGQGSLTSLSGYKFAFNNAGRVTVGKKALAATVVVNDKTYDGSTEATGKFTSLDGLVQGDVVEVGGTLTFASKNAGTHKVTVENLGLAGDDAGNYTITINVPDQLTGTIFKKAVTVQVAVDDKTYDGTTKANGRVTGINGKIAGDDLVATGGSYAYGDKNAGADKLVTISNIQVGGADAGNYEVAIPVSALADILKKAATVNISVDNKTYDRTTTATGRINGIDGLIAGDDVGATGGSYAFTDKNAGKGKTVNVSGIQLSGDDLGNYDVTIPATVLAEILKRAVTVSIAVDDKTYDGTTTATGRITGMDGLLAGDDLTVAGGIFSFTDKNAGQDKAAAASGFTYGGADAGNYEAVVAPGATADIAKRAITVRANDAWGTIFDPSVTFSYAVTDGSLAPGDAFTGALAREPGFIPGEYAIGIGTLGLSSNYDVTFQGGTFTLELGTPPSWMQVPSLYRSVELGGRAAVFQNEPRALVWAQAFDCQGSTRQADQCQ